jgi:hypothetical protein
MLTGGRTRPTRERISIMTTNSAIVAVFDKHGEAVELAVHGA